jgi:hypothetical protein
MLKNDTTSRLNSVKIQLIVTSVLEVERLGKYILVSSLSVCIQEGNAIQIVPKNQLRHQISGNDCTVIGRVVQGGK